MSLKMQCAICEQIFDAQDTHAFKAEIITSRKKKVFVEMRVPVIAELSGDNQHNSDHVCRQCAKAIIRGQDT
jgi:hypothetical protein